MDCLPNNEMYILPKDAFNNVVMLTGICEVKLYALIFSTYIYIFCIITVFQY